MTQIKYTTSDLSIVEVCREATGRKITSQFVSRRDIVVCVPVDETGKFILIRQWRAAAAGVVTEFPAGKVEALESHEAACRRELLEEAGFVPETLHFLGKLQIAPHFADETAHVYHAVGRIAAPPAPEPEEDIVELVQVTKQRLIEMFRAGEVRDAKSLAAFSLLELVD